MTADLRSFFDENGNLKPIHALTPEQGACLASLEVVKKNAEAGDGHVDTVCKLKLWDKLKALEMAAKHLGVLTEKVEHDVEVTFRWLNEENELPLNPRQGTALDAVH